MLNKMNREFLDIRVAALFYSLILALGLIPASPAGAAPGSIDLDAAFSLAVENHERIQIAQAETEKNKLLPQKANSLMLPKLAVEGSYRRAGEPIEFEAEIAGFTLPPIETVPKEQVQGRFNLTQPIYEGEYFPLKRKSRQLIEGGLEYYSKTVQDILFGVAQAYYEVFKAKELLRNAQEILELNEEALRVARVKFDSGDLTEDVVLRAELNLTQAESMVIKNQNQLMIATDYLKRLIGLEGQLPELIPPPEKTLVIRTFDELMELALDNRYDYKIARTQIRVAETDIDVAKSRFHPRMRGTWDYYLVDDPSFLQDDDYWVAEVKLEIPIFDGGLKSLNLKEERENLKQAQLECENLKDRIRNEVQSALLNESTYRSILRNSEKKVRLAVKSHEILFSKFRFGSATILELDQAVTLLNSAKTELINNKYDYQVQLLVIEKAIGLFAETHVDKASSESPKM